MTKRDVKMQERTRSIIYSHLDRTSLVNKGFIVWLKRELVPAGPTREIPNGKMGPSCRSGSQLEHRISFILSARGFSDITIFLSPQYLPKEELYTPPMNIKVHDNRSFGRKPVVGIHSMKSMIKFRCEPASFDDALESPIG